MINLVTSPGYLWFLWPASFIAAFLAGDALKAYYPGLVGADDHGWQKIGGDATFSKDTRFRGRIDGNVVVARGVHLELSGNIGGHVLNRGGTLRLSGKLVGQLREEEGAAPPAATAGQHEHSHRS